MPVTDTSILGGEGIEMCVVCLVKLILVMQPNRNVRIVYQEGRAGAVGKHGERKSCLTL